MSTSPEMPPKLPPFLERAAAQAEDLPPPRRRPWKAVGAIVVVAIILLAVVFLAGVIPRQSGTTNTPTFSGAEQAANSAAGRYGSGHWSSIVAVAIATQASLSLSASEIEMVIDAASCNVTWAPTAPSTVIVPSTPSGTPDGGSAAWFFLYSDGVRTVLLVAVTNNSGQALFTATGGNCTLAAEFIQPLSQSGVVDSSTAVSAADRKGGAAFLSTHLAANRTWAVTGAVAVIGQPQWYVYYSTCPIPLPANTTVTAPGFNSTIDAQTGTPIRWGNVTATCSLAVSFPLGHPASSGGRGSAGLSWLAPELLPGRHGAAGTSSPAPAPSGGSTSVPFRGRTS